MNRRNTISIVILAGLALSGLVFIQLYWIRNAIDLKESYFRKNAGEAMSAVVHKLERLEAAKRFHSMMQPGFMMGEMPFPADSLSSAEAESPADSVQSTIMVTIGDQCYIYQGRDRRGRIMRDVIMEMFESNPWEPVSSRVKPEVLDSLLRAELSIRGIDTRFEYGIYSPQFHQLRLERTGRYPDQLVQEGMSINLSPGNLLRDSEYLLLYFPRQTGFLLQQMSGLLIGSLLFIIIIALSFYYAASTIFRQKKLSEMKNDFINNMTHEFKTPISTVALACEALSDRSLPSSRQVVDEYIGIIRQENERLGGMAEKVLQTAIIEKGELRLRLEELSFHGIVDDALQHIRLQVAHREGKVDWAPGAVDDMVRGDRLHLTNVVSNLLDNAVKYSEGKPSITLSTENSEGGLLCSVRDEGVGISKAEQRRVFEKLYRVHTGNLHNVKGFGLGLSYVKAIVEHHGGRVAVESEPGRGSTFTVWLPQS